MKKPLLLAVQGPTASGKTRIAIELAKHFKTVIISCDSRQFFTELKIGAAPPSSVELAEVTHYFIQHLSINDDYNAGAFERDALMKLEELFKTHEIVIMVGGSGLYADAVLKGFDDLPKADAALRASLQQKLETKGIESLQNDLRQKDLVYFQKVDKDNAHRLIRALEVIEQTGKPYSEMRSNVKSNRHFHSINLVMDLPRDILYERINNRVDAMMALGLEAEARDLLKYRSVQALNTVGYKELFAYFDGELELPEAISLIKQNTRRFAKRQLTWLRRDKNAIWISPDNIDKMKSLVEERMKSNFEE